MKTTPKTIIIENVQIESRPKRTIIIPVEITTISSSKNSTAYLVHDVVTKKGGYKTIDLMSQEQIDYVIESTAKDLYRIKEKLSGYPEFATAIPHLESAIESLK